MGRRNEREETSGGNKQGGGIAFGGRKCHAFRSLPLNSPLAKRLQMPVCGRMNILITGTSLTASEPNVP